MVVAYQNGDNMPTIFEEDENDNIEVRSLKRIIKYMTQYHKQDRKSIHEVEDELTGTVIFHFQKGKYTFVVSNLGSKS